MEAYKKSFEMKFNLLWIPLALAFLILNYQVLLYIPEVFNDPYRAADTFGLRVIGGLLLIKSQLVFISLFSIFNFLIIHYASYNKTAAKLGRFLPLLITLLLIFIFFGLGSVSGVGGGNPGLELIAFFALIFVSILIIIPTFLIQVPFFQLLQNDSNRKMVRKTAYIFFGALFIFPVAVYIFTLLTLPVTTRISVEKYMWDIKNAQDITHQITVFKPNYLPPNVYLSTSSKPFGPVVNLNLENNSNLGIHGNIEETKPDGYRIDELMSKGPAVIKIHNLPGYILVEQQTNYSVRTRLLFNENGTQIYLIYINTNLDNKPVTAEEVKNEVIKIAESLKPM